MRTCIILNPESGSADQVESLEGHLHRLGEHVILTTDRDGPDELAREALREGFDTIVAAGGDGTVNGVLNGLAECFASKTRRPPRLGILPLGTGNDFARALNLPLDDLPHAADILAAGHARPTDVARVETSPPRYFLNSAGLGFTARLGENIDGGTKDWWGTIAYLIGAARTLPELEAFRLQAVLDGERVECNAYNVLVDNGPFIGGGTPVAPDARIDDGKLDVLVVPALAPAELVAVLPKILAGTHMEDERVIRRQAARIELTCDRPVPFNIDGEPAGDSPVTIQTLPHAIDVIRAG